jgi:hypothetical protein
LTTGIGKRAHNYKFNHIYFEPAIQHHVIERVQERFGNKHRCLFMAYGQTGSGKTHTMSGGAWKNNGLIQQYVLDTIDGLKNISASVGKYVSLGVTMS